MSCILCDKGYPTIKHYYVGAERRNGEKIQLKVSKADFERIQKMQKENLGAKLILKDENV